MNEEIRKLNERIAEITARNAKEIEEAHAQGRLREVVRTETMYGPFPGGDPRKFWPDPECSTPEEIERHRQACEQAKFSPAQCQLMGDGSNARGVGYGLGTSEVEVRFLLILDSDGKVIKEFA